MLTLSYILHNVLNIMRMIWMRRPCYPHFSCSYMITMIYLLLYVLTSRKNCKKYQLPWNLSGKLVF